MIKYKFKTIPFPTRTSVPTKLLHCENSYSAYQRNTAFGINMLYNLCGYRIKNIII